MKTHFHVAALINSCRQLENVAADRVARLNRRRGPGQLARVSRIPKMIENGFAEHKVRNEVQHTRRTQSILTPARTCSSRPAASCLLSSLCERQSSSTNTAAHRFAGAQRD